MGIPHYKIIVYLTLALLTYNIMVKIEFVPL